MALCVGCLILLIFTVLGGYVKNSLDFALKETGGSLLNKTQLLSDILLDIRRSPVLMDALQSGGLISSADGDSQTQTAFSQAAGFAIYSNKNTDKLDGYFLSAVYLFDAKGGCHRAAYVDREASLQAAIDGQYERLYKDFLKFGKDVWVIERYGQLNIVYTLYDDAIEPCGTVIFSVNEDAIRQIMQKAMEYKDAFWVIQDKAGKTIMQQGAIPNGLDGAFGRTDNPGPYTFRSGSGSYRVYEGAVSMGIRGILGVSSNQLLWMLFDSVKFYVYALAVSLVLIGFFIFFVMMRMTRPLSEVPGRLQMVAEQNFDVKLPHYSTLEFEAVSQAFNIMTETIAHLINDVYEKKLLVMDMEMKVLQSQMNPHFLYNVLNALALKAQMDGNEEVCRMTSNLSSLMQARLSHRGSEKVSIGQELQYVRFYMELQKFRFGDKLEYEISMEDEALLRYRIPKFTIELIAENAVMHGVEPKTGPGVVRIGIHRGADGIDARIEDDGVGFEGEEGPVSLPLPEPEAGPTGAHNHIALNTAYRMIRHFYGERYGITIYSGRHKGTRVTVSVPYDEEEEDVPGHSGGR